MVHAETQTYNPVNTHLWADEQFAFHEFVAPPEGTVDSQQANTESESGPQPWCKVCNITAMRILCMICNCTLRDMLDEQAVSYVAQRQCMLGIRYCLS